MAANSKVYMFEKDREMIKDLVLCDPNQEMEGDLFGLWTSKDEPVLQYVAEPSNRCLPSYKRDEVHPDDMKKILTEKYGMEHLGKWRYNRATSFESRQIDCLPLLIAVTVDGHGGPRPSVKMSPIIYKEGRGEPREIEILHGERAFRGIKEISDKLKDIRRGSDLGVGNVNNTGTQILQSTTSLPNSGKSASFLDEGDMKRRNLPALTAYPKFSACRTQPFKVHMFQEDMDMISDLVLQYPDLETGGQLFGLWTTEGEPAVHIVLGPGKDCRRTGTSFYQDVPYLERVGKLLTTKFQLCHIGEWHSHHQLRLSRPSQGDSSTVIRNYPRGVCGFLLIIANIVPPGYVSLSPYLYSETSRFDFDLSGEVVAIGGGSAFRNVGRIQAEIKRGEGDRAPEPMEIGYGHQQGNKHSSSTTPHYTRSTKPKAWKH